MTIWTIWRTAQYWRAFPIFSEKTLVKEFHWLSKFDDSVALQLLIFTGIHFNLIFYEENSKICPTCSSIWIGYYFDIKLLKKINPNFEENPLFLIKTLKIQIGFWLRISINNPWSNFTTLSDRISTIYFKFPSLK